MPLMPVPLDSLIAFVRERHRNGDSLDRLSDAILTAEQLNEQADALIGHFVDQARASGASWSQIGAAMGVSKQAAQKRFVGREDETFLRGGAFTRFTPRAQSAVAAAGALANEDGSGEIGPAHLVAGLLVDGDGVAARAVSRLEVSADELRQALGVGKAPAVAVADLAELRGLQFGARCRAVFKESLKAALRRGHNYIGTEHLLLGVVAADGEMVERLAGIGLSPDAVDTAVTAEFADLVLRRRRDNT